MSESTQTGAACTGLFVIRKPILDREQQVYGHELDAGASVSELAGDMAGIPGCMTDGGMEMTLGGDERGRRIVVTLGQQLLMDDGLLDLPHERTVFVFGQDVQAGPEVLERVALLRDAGFSLGVTVGERKRTSPSLMEHADIVRVRLDGLNPKEIMDLVRVVKPLGKPMLASGVDEWQTYEGTRALGFAYFQGAFIRQPKIEPGRKLSENSLSRIRLLQELLRPGCDLNEVASIISQDSMLSFRLLKFINSASFCLVNKVTSIQQAVAYLGLNQLKQWASFMVVADMDSSSKGEELSYSGLQRARFLGRCAELASKAPTDSDAMFMAGLFSRLDAMLGMPMRQVLEGMPLDERISGALLGTPNEVSTWLELADCIDCGSWARARSLVTDLNLDPQDVSVEYLRASAWAGERCRDHRKIA